MENVYSLLDDPNLGSKLLADPKGELAIQVWSEYFWRHSNNLRSVFQWCFDPTKNTAIDPQKAVDDVQPLLWRAVYDLKYGLRDDALARVCEALKIILLAHSDHQPGSGRPSIMKHFAVRAYLIQRFNRDPNARWESSVALPDIADRLFSSESGTCTREVRDKGICGVTNHKSSDPCVRALRRAVNDLKDAMKSDGIPV
jgi:hypothetical protein